MPELNKAKLALALLAAAGVVGIVSTIAYMGHDRSVSQCLEPSAAGPQQTQSIAPPDANGPASGRPIPLGSRFGYNSPAPPPIIFWGPPPRDRDRPDLNTPAIAIQTIMSLVDQEAIDTLGLCVLEETDYALSGLYPRCLGQPVGLVEVVEDGDSATVVWEAAVHTGFSLQGRRWSPGETMMLTSRLVRVEGLWKLMQWHDGGEDDEQPGQSTN